MRRAGAQQIDDQRKRVNQRDVQQVIKQRDTAKQRQCAREPASCALSKRKQGNQWAERHHQKERRGGILPLIKKPDV